MNIPNMLTLLRIALIPVYVVLFYLPAGWAYKVCAFVFAVAAITDLLDGWLARRLQQVSSLGAFLDPVADKLMVSTALVLLVQRDPQPWVALSALVIIGREITISALREWMAELGERTQVAVSMVGKFKTATQMTAIFFMIYQAPYGGFATYTVGLVLLYIATILTLWSMVVYIQAAWPSLMGQEED